MGKPETEFKILRAAVSLFSQKSYESVKTKELARSAGVSEVTLFRYFPAKKELYIRVFKEYHRTPDYAGLLKDAGYSLRTDLMRIGEAFLDALGENADLLRMNNKNAHRFPEIHAELRKHPLLMEKEMKKYFSAMKRKEGLVDQPDSLAVIFTHSIFGIIFTFLQDDEASDRAIRKNVRDFISVFVRGTQRVAESAS